jgi:hypothetical protein
MLPEPPVPARPKPPSCDGYHFAQAKAASTLHFVFDQGLGRFVMAKVVKNAGGRVVRWFKALQEKNRPPYLWYEHSLYDA